MSGSNQIIEGILMQCILLIHGEIDLVLFSSQLSLASLLQCIENMVFHNVLLKYIFSVLSTACLYSCQLQLSFQCESTFGIIQTIIIINKNFSILVSQVHSNQF